MASEAQRRRWAGRDGLPTIHVCQAALHAASLIDSGGSPLAEARESYWHKATGGTFTPVDLATGEALLKDVGLVAERDGRLFLSGPLEELLDGSPEDAYAGLALEASCLSPPPEEAEPEGLEGALEALVPDAQRREELLLARAQRFDDSTRRLIGEIGEQTVVRFAREELVKLGREDLARQVRRVSLGSDALGYDVNAPRVTGQPRLLEVKSTTRPGEAVSIHISRNEANVGERFAAWALVLCRVVDVDARRAEVCGWCPASAFAGRLPQDSRGGRWEHAAIEIRQADLTPGLPLPTL